MPYVCVLQVLQALMEWLGLRHTHTYSLHPHAPPQHFTWPQGRGPCVTTQPAVEPAILFTDSPRPSLQTRTADWPALQPTPFPRAETLLMWAGQTERRFPAHRLAFQSRSPVCLVMPPSSSISCPALLTMPSPPIRAHRARTTASDSIVRMAFMDTTFPPHHDWLLVQKRWLPHRARSWARPQAVL